MSPKTFPRVLTVAGSDSCGGAGIQADLKTFAALGCYGMSAITALTAQNTLGVKGVVGTPPSFVAAQMDAVLEDIGADAVKIGMLFSSAIIDAVADSLKRRRPGNIVLDPVMSSQTGINLLEDDALLCLRERLMPLADIVTPNLPETEILTGRPVKTVKEMKTAAMRLASGGCRNVLIKGGHLTDPPCMDILYAPEEDRFIELPGIRIPTRNNHGTGCTLSSAIAAYLAKGCGLEQSVRNAKAFIEGAIRGGVKYRIGGGHGPVNHFWKIRDLWNAQ